MGFHVADIAIRHFSQRGEAEMKSAALIAVLALGAPLAMAGDGVLQLTTSEFDDVVDGSAPALVEFYAPVRGRGRPASVRGRC